MKKLVFAALLCLVGTVAMAQPRMTYEEKVVYEGEDVTFRQIDAHTWEGNGKMMANETLYIVEGEERALLIDAGTNIKDLDKIVDFVLHELHSGATLNEIIGAYDKTPNKELITIVDKNEYKLLMDYIRKIDPKAFVTVYSVSEMRYQPKVKP